MKVLIIAVGTDLTADVPEGFLPFSLASVANAYGNVAHYVAAVERKPVAQTQAQEKEKEKKRT